MARVGVWVTLATLVGAGCSAAPQEPLGMVAQRSTVLVEVDGSDGPWTLDLRLEPQTSTGLMHCPTVSPATRASLDEVPLRVISLGDLDHDALSSRCEAPEMALDAVPPALLARPSSTIVVTDEDSKVTLSVAGLFSEGALALASPGDGVLHPGGELDVTWSVPGDTFSPDLWPSLGFVPDDPASGLYFSVPAMPSGTALVGVVPALEGLNAPVTGTLSAGALFLRPVSRCDGAAACLVEVDEPDDDLVVGRVTLAP